MSFAKTTVSVLALSLALAACGNKEVQPASKSEEPAAKSESTSATDAVKEKASDAMDATKEAASDVKDAAGAAMNKAVDNAADMKGAAGDAMQAAGDKAAEAAGNIMDKTKEAAGDAMGSAANAAQGTMGKATEAAAGAKEAAVAAITIPAALEGANIKLGKKEFNKCKACHTAGKGQPNRIGPNLYGVFGRKAGSVEKFRYSKAMKGVDWTWNLETLDKWITNPRADLPGTHMTFVGIKDETMRKNLLAYLYTETGGEASE